MATLITRIIRGFRKIVALPKVAATRQKYLRILNEFSITMVGVNAREELYWHVAREVVGRLGFDDCVVYELDMRTNTLIQKAAIGPKNPKDDQILNVLEIPLGKGITGAVAASGKSTIVEDLTEDPRYLPDMESARSEICVPLLIQNVCVGVIDCEDPRARHFNASHLEILTTVASLLSSKLQQCEVLDALKDKHVRLTKEISERMNAEAALRQQNENMEAEVAKRTEALTTSLDKLKRETANRSLAERNLRSNQILLLKAEKMASVGTLAAGIAHEINNPIGYVMSNLQATADYFKQTKGDTVAEHNLSENDAIEAIEESIEGTRRVINIVKDLREYVTAGQEEIEKTDINDLMEKTLRVAAGELKYSAAVVKEYGELPHVWCIPGRLSQVFLNLLINASQAITDNGEIRISTHSNDTYVSVEIADNGEGISAADLEQIFDPFFTTKGVGEGMGLGLHICKGIVEQHGARIDVKSQPGSGTTFMIDLPRRRAAA